MKLSNAVHFLQGALAAALTMVAVVCAVVTGALIAEAVTADPAPPAPLPVTVPAAITLPDPLGASYTASKSKAWNTGIEAGLDYWLGRDGSTANTTIVRDMKNRCGKAAMACTVGFSDGTCRIWIKAHVLEDRWATIAVGLHEVGHCMGHGHDDRDLVMHG